MARLGLKFIISISLLIFVFFIWAYFHLFLYNLVGGFLALTSIPICIVLYISIIKIIFKLISPKDADNNYININQNPKKKFSWKSFYKLKTGGYFTLIFIILITIIIVTMDLSVKYTNDLTQKWISLFFIFEMIILFVVVAGFRGWYEDNQYAKSIEKKKKEFGEDYLDETVRRFKEKYPDNKDLNVIPQDIRSYAISRSFRKVEKEVLKERKQNKYK